MIARRRLASSALPLLLVTAVPGLAAAKSATPPQLAACRPGRVSRSCAEAKARFRADGGSGGGCPHCAASSKGGR